MANPSTASESHGPQGLSVYPIRVVAVPASVGAAK